MVKNISAFKDAGVHLQKWIAQKEKMMAVLGPISTEKEMNQNQVEQVKVSILLWTAVKWWIFLWSFAFPHLRLYLNHR